MQKKIKLSIAKNEVKLLSAYEFRAHFINIKWALSHKRTNNCQTPTQKNGAL